MEFLLSAVLCVAELPQPFPTGSSNGTKLSVCDCISESLNSSTGISVKPVGLRHSAVVKCFLGFITAAITSHIAFSVAVLHPRGQRFVH